MQTDAALILGTFAIAQGEQAICCSRERVSKSLYDLLTLFSRLMTHSRRAHQMCRQARKASFTASKMDAGFTQSPTT